MHAKDCDYENRIVTKIVSAIVVLSVVFLSLSNFYVSSSLGAGWGVEVCSFSVSNSAYQIDMHELTKAIIREDHTYETPFGDLDPPTPSSGVVLVPMNMLCPELVRVSYEIKKDSELETVKALCAFDVENLHWHEGDLDWTSPARYSFRKDSAQEMFAWRDYTGKITGNCYSHASFNTAALRMAGFPSEQVFDILIPGHVVTLVKADGDWYIIDSTGSIYNPSVSVEEKLYSFYNIGVWRGLENDKYYVNFENGVSNMLPDLVVEIVNEARGTLENPSLGMEPSIYRTAVGFTQRAGPVDAMVCKEVPHTISDCSTPEELVAKNFEFINKTAIDSPDSQYMKALVARCPREEQFYPVYANAAKYGPWAEQYGTSFDKNTLEDNMKAVFEFFKEFNNTYIVNANEVTFGDFSLLVKGGSTLDQAIAAYGVMRNTRVGGDHTSRDSLCILINENNEGYLAVDVPGQGWQYMDFSNKELTSNCPISIVYSFNEEGASLDWIEKNEEQEKHVGTSLPIIIPIVFILILIATSAIIYDLKTKKISKIIKQRKK